MAYYWRGAARWGSGDIKGAISDFSQSISINPRYSDAYIERGRSLEMDGNVQQAIADLNQAIAIDPRNRYAYYVRGDIERHSLRDMRAACDDYRTSASLGYLSAAAVLKKDCVHSDCRPACIMY
jgi:tetratricopeptide (TPR) repeat protein